MVSESLGSSFGDSPSSAMSSDFILSENTFAGHFDDESVFNQNNSFLDQLTSDQPILNFPLLDEIEVSNFNNSDVGWKSSNCCDGKTNGEENIAPIPASISNTTMTNSVPISATLFDSHYSSSNTSNGTQGLSKNDSVQSGSNEQWETTYQKGKVGTCGSQHNLNADHFIPIERHLTQLTNTTSLTKNVNSRLVLKENAVSLHETDECTSMDCGIVISSANKTNRFSTYQSCTNNEVTTSSVNRDSSELCALPTNRRPSSSYSLPSVSTFHTDTTTDQIRNQQNLNHLLTSLPPWRDNWLEDRHSQDMYDLLDSSSPHNSTTDTKMKNTFDLNFDVLGDSSSDLPDEQLINMTVRELNRRLRGLR